MLSKYIENKNNILNNILKKILKNIIFYIYYLFNLYYKINIVKNWLLYYYIKLIYINIWNILNKILMIFIIKKTKLFDINIYIIFKIINKKIWKILII